MPRYVLQIQTRRPPKKCGNFVSLITIANIFLTIIFSTSCRCRDEAITPQKIRDDVAAKEKRDAMDKAFRAEADLLSRWMRANTVSSIVPAVAAVVVKDGRVVYRDTVGCNPDTPFGVASLTKTFTAIAVLQLAEKGFISLDEPISKYLNVDFENPSLDSQRITIWHLLTHTSGLVEDPDPRVPPHEYPFTVPEQRYPAGLRFHYCNQGYNLLGFIVFEASGQTLSEYIKRNILIPLEMYDSKAPASMTGAAGVQCSINDLARYLTMFINGGAFRGKRIISKRMFEKIVMETVEEPKARRKEYRGLCFRVWAVDGRIVSLHHAAHMPGVGGFMQFFPRHGCGYVFISNPPVYEREEYYSYYHAMKSRMMRLCRALMEDGFDPLSFQADRPTEEQLRMFVGRYVQKTSGRYVTVELHPGGYLVAMKSYTGLRVAIVPTSLHTFVYIYPGQTEKGEIYDFVMKNGTVLGLGVKEGYFVLEN